MRVGYATGPFNVALASAAPTTPLATIKPTNLGGQWDFGVAKLMAHYTVDRHDGRRLTAKGYLIGGLIPVGAGEIRLAYSQLQDRRCWRRRRASKIALGYVHNLSKRTALYTTYARVTNSGGAAASSERRRDCRQRHVRPATTSVSGTASN